MQVKKRGATNPLNRRIAEVKYGYIVGYKSKTGSTTKHFAFTTFGGKRNALAAARQFRDKATPAPAAKSVAAKRRQVSKRAVSKGVKRRK